MPRDSGREHKCTLKIKLGIIINQGLGKLLSPVRETTILSARLTPLLGGLVIGLSVTPSASLPSASPGLWGGCGPGTKVRQHFFLPLMPGLPPFASVAGGEEEAERW